MHRPPHAPLAAILLPLLVLAPLLVLSPLGCGDDDGTQPQPDPCGIEIYTPAPGTLFYSQEVVNLRWHASGGGTVRIELLKAGAVVDTLDTGTPNDGYYPWPAGTRGATSGDDFALRVTATADAACTDSLPITLVNTEGCAITMTAPPDMALDAGQEYLVTWESENTGGTVDVELWSGNVGEKELVGVIARDLADDGSYLWQPVDSFHRGTNTDYYLRVVDTRVTGCRDEVGPITLTDPDICTIEITPPPEELTIGQQLTIAFFPDNTTADLSIRLYVLGIPVPGGRIADDVPAASGQYTWTVTDYGYEGGDDDRYRIVIFDPDDIYCRGESRTFTIR